MITVDSLGTHLVYMGFSYSSWQSQLARCRLVNRHVYFHKLFYSKFMLAGSADVAASSRHAELLQRSWIEPLVVSLVVQKLVPISRNLLLVDDDGAGLDFFDHIQRDLDAFFALGLTLDKRPKNRVH